MTEETSAKRTLNMELLQGECDRRGLTIRLEGSDRHRWSGKPVPFRYTALAVVDEQGRRRDDVTLERRGWTIPVEIAASMLLAQIRGERYYP